MSSQEESAKARASMEALVGREIDRRYKLDELLGLGGMGAVYRATHMLLGQAVAVKVMRNDAAEDEESRKRFLREAQMLASLRSPHIARVADAGTLDDGGVYFVMELLEGEDLLARLKHHSFSPEEVVSFAFQVCAGLREAHAAGVVHRDLKPSNIFFAKTSPVTEVVKILDFGIAKRTQSVDDKITSSVKILGSPSYMAPEQIANSRDVDGRADIWSLGVVLYGMLAGKLPFGDDSLTALLLQIVNKDPAPLPEHVPQALKDVVSKALAKKPEHRFADVAEMEAALLGVGGSRSSARELRVAAPVVEAQVAAPPAAASPEIPTKIIDRPAEVQAMAIPAVAMAIEVEPPPPGTARSDRTVRTRLEEPSRGTPTWLVLGALALALVAVGVAGTAIGALLEQRRATVAASTASLGAPPSPPSSIVLIQTAAAAAPPAPSAASPLPSAKPSPSNGRKAPVPGTARRTAPTVDPLKP